MNIKLNSDALRYGDTLVLHPLNLDIATGQCVAVVGESGAGKSSFLALLRKEVQDNSAWCPQEKGLAPSLSAFHNIYAGTLNQHSVFYNILNFFWPQTRALAQVKRIAEPLGINNFLKQKTNKLSGGQQQRVAIARALIQEREIFIGDEPTSALDPVMAQQLLDTIIKQHQTTIVALHDVDLALHACDRIIGLKDGNIALDAPANTLTKHDLFFLYPHERI